MTDTERQADKETERDIGGILHRIHIAIITAQTNSISRTTLVNRVVGDRPRKSLTAIGVINTESDGRGVIKRHIPRRDSAFSRPADRRRTYEMSVPARLGGGMFV